MQTLPPAPPPKVGPQGRRRRATFSSELRQLRRSLTAAGRSQQPPEPDPEAAAADADFGSQVRFDIWAEQEVGAEAGGGIEEEEAAAGGKEECWGSYELPFDYVPHPLVVSYHHPLTLQKGNKFINLAQLKRKQ